MTRAHRRVFVSATGDYPNIGDAIIRRRVVDWASHPGSELVAYLGSAPESWIQQLSFPSDARVLRGRQGAIRWLVEIAVSPKVALFFEPGEVALGRSSSARELVFLVVTALVRIKGGVTVRPPRAITPPARLPLRLHRWAARLSQFTLWRESTSAEWVEAGEIVPDIGFSAGRREGLPWHERDTLVVSMRGRRDSPSDTWVSAIRQFAGQQGLRILVCTQVEQDAARSAELAERLDAELQPWGGDDLHRHEEDLRRAYDRAKLVVSDRLHVLIIASLSGAVPAELASNPTPKVRRHFQTVGFDNVSMDATDASVEAMGALLLEQIGRHDELVASVEQAESVLTQCEVEVRRAVFSDSGASSGSKDATSPGQQGLTI